MDGSGLIRFANRQVEGLFGYRPEELLGRSVELLVPQRVRGIHAADRFRRYALQPTTRPMGTGRALFARRKDGTAFPVDISLSSHDTDAGTLVLAAVRDITERRAAEEALQQVTERFRAAFEDAPIGMALIDMDGRPVQVNDALCRLLGKSKAKILAGSSSFLEGEGIAIVSSVRSRLLTGPERVVREERQQVRPDGQGEWFLVGVSLLSGAGGRPAHFLVQVQDISATREAEERLAYRALHDPLTGLANRTLVVDRVEQALARSRRTGGVLGLLFLDLDHFKVVNDSLGHDAGDRLLASVGVRLRALLREGDTAGRLGGDEFVLVFENLGGEEEARVIAGRVGRGRYEMFDEAMRLRAMERLKIEAELRAGLTDGELRLFYQPQVTLRTGDVAGFEALVRWQHPKRGILPPREFIGIAEESDLMVPVGNWILEQACKDAASWMRHRTDLMLSVNLSARQLADPMLPESVSRILEESGLPPSALCFEITESALQLNTNSTAPCLATLSAMGVRLSLDDFGTGYASLTYLAKIRPDEVKIDESIVRQLGQTDEAQAIVAAVIALAHNLSLVAIAEGVETDEQRQVVESLGCDRAQGFLFGPQVETQAIGRLLRQRAEMNTR